MESTQRKPLVVDLDGTLIMTDSLIESILLLLMQHNRFEIFSLLRLINNKAKFKAEMAKVSLVTPDTWPYRDDLLHYLRREFNSGRKIYLATGANHKIAEDVVAYLGLFEGFFASDDSVNLTGHRKAARLKEAFGVNGFSYVGNHPVDKPIWEIAETVFFAGPVQSLKRRFGETFAVSETFPDPRISVKLIFKAIRVHQWVKNLLVFVPLLFAHRIFELSMIKQSLMAFFAFSFCASSAYLINDLADLRSDRSHPIKKKRPFASGQLNIMWGMLLSPIFLTLGFVIGLQISTAFFATLLAYFLLTYIYSFLLKRLLLIDIFTLATLYTLRIFAGAMATSIEISTWLLAFSIFMFFDLAIVKRVSELLMMKKLNKDKSSGRGYRVNDLDILKMFGISSGFVSVMVLALYISHEKVTILYHKPYLLWLICPIFLYWICRIWMITERGYMHSDPIVFALRDRVSYIIALICGIIGWLAI